VDVLGLPHAIMITTANVTDRSGAIDMVDYYWDVTNHLSILKKILADGGYTGENFTIPSKLFLVQMLRLSSAMNSTLLLYCQNIGLWRGLSSGLINAGDFGKTANANCRTLFKRSPSLLSVYS